MKQTTLNINPFKMTHDRPLATLVQIANRFQSQIYMVAGETKINAKSIMGMFALDLRDKQELHIIADGVDEAEAVKAFDEYALSVAN